MICESKTPCRLTWRHQILLLLVAGIVLPLSLQAEQETPPLANAALLAGTRADSTPSSLSEHERQLAADVLKESNITVERKSYGTDLGIQIADLLEQMQRSGIVDPLVVHRNHGPGGRWNDGQWHYTAGLTVVTDPDAQKSIGKLIYGLNELRPALGTNIGEEELDIQEVAYDRQWNWDTSRRLVRLLDGAAQMGIIRFATATSDEDGRLVISTTKEVHEVLERFIAFLNEQTADRDRHDSATSTTTSKDAAPPDSKIQPSLVVSAQVDENAATSSDSAGQPVPVGDLYRSGDPLSIPPFAENAFRSRQQKLAGYLLDSALQPVDQTRPEALTAPEDYEEITVVAQEYELPTQVAHGVQGFLASVEAGFPVLVTSLRSKPGETEYGGFDSGFGEFGAVMGMASPNAILRVIAPAEMQEALGGFLKSMQQPTDDEPGAARTITLVRAEYSMPTAAVDAFATLILAYQQSGLAMPLVVKRSGNKLSLTAPRDVHEHVRKFVAFLGEHWKTAGLTGERPQTPWATFVEDTFVEDKAPRAQQAASREVLELDLQIAKREVELAQEKVAEVKRLYEEGHVHRTDVSNAELEVLKAQRAVKQLESMIESAREKQADGHRKTNSLLTN